jgi:hypothetical protein
LGTLVLNLSSLNPFLDYEKIEEEDSNEPFDEHVYYEEPNLSG